MFRPYFLRNSILKNIAGLLFIGSLVLIVSSIFSIIFIAIFNATSTFTEIPFNFISISIGSLLQFCSIWLISKLLK